VTNVVYYCGPHDNVHLLKPGAYYVDRKGKEVPYNAPAVNGIAFGYTVESNEEMPENPRGVRFIVLVNAVRLDVPVRIRDDGAHLGFRDDGRAKWLGPKPANVDDDHAQALLRDVIGANPLKRNALSGLLQVASPQQFAGEGVRVGAGIRTILEKAARDSGFDLERGEVGRWLIFESTHAPLKVWLTAAGTGGPVAAVSMGRVGRALQDEGHLLAVSPAPPPGAAWATEAADVPTLLASLRRAFQLSRALPNEILHVFEQRTASLPRTTEAERLVVQRVGQDIFRERLIEYWDGRCAVTGLAVPELLRASHIKPWASCASDAERLDVFNGLLLAPHLDALFDGGFITVEDSGEVVVSPVLSHDARVILDVARPMRIRKLMDHHREYMAWHRQHSFQQTRR
jgi:hypothetical protein